MKDQQDQPHDQPKDQLLNDYGFEVLAVLLSIGFAYALLYMVWDANHSAIEARVSDINSKVEMPARLSFEPLPPPPGVLAGIADAAGDAAPLK